MKKRYFFVILSILCGIRTINAQQKPSIEQLRAESGVDPTKVMSRVGYSVMFYDKEGGNAQVDNRLTFTLGINRWSFSIKPDIVSLLDGNSPNGFKTGMGDIKLNMLNAFYVKGNIALAGMIEFGLPTGTTEFGSGYFSLSPGITMSYTINQSLFLAVQPQYTFALAKSDLYPSLSVLTVRIFGAKFFKSGLFIVLEPRIINNFTNDDLDVIISPLVGQALGKGFNLIGLAEIPTKNSTIKQRGVLYQVGVSKSF